ncbi:unnamed protein product [Nesidiocoris tenuis]|uniref:Uncharacterized protein n=1 Tax=Nesidiocoris tenuis TaxID=355587 RepID=A0A6H5HR85_9HEMI|nr:unnamed protein product [Nesidiocoris tenuis]
MRLPAKIMRDNYLDLRNARRLFPFTNYRDSKIFDVPRGRKDCRQFLQQSRVGISTTDDVEELSLADHARGHGREKTFLLPSTNALP